MQDTPRESEQPCQHPYKKCPHPETEHDERRDNGMWNSNYDPCRTCASERQAKEEAERAAAIAEIDTMAKGIASALTGDWTAQPHKGDMRDYGVWREIRSADGLNIDLDRRTGSSGRGRVTIRVDRPDDIREYTQAVGRYPKHSEISVSASRPVAAIARDIERRLLPPFLADVERIRGERDQWSKRNTSAQAAAEKLAKAAGDPSAAQPRQHYGSERRNPVSFYAARSEFEVYGDDQAVSVTIKARSVSLATALRIAAILAKESGKK